MFVHDKYRLTSLIISTSLRCNTIDGPGIRTYATLLQLYSAISVLCHFISNGYLLYRHCMYMTKHYITVTRRRGSVIIASGLLFMY